MRGASGGLRKGRKEETIARKWAPEPGVEAPDPRVVVEEADAGCYGPPVMGPHRPCVFKNDVRYH
eukprot:13659745-Alexandrium_andersonii.AAC.1